MSGSERKRRYRRYSGYLARKKRAARWRRAFIILSFCLLFGAFMPLLTGSTLDLLSNIPRWFIIQWNYERQFLAGKYQGPLVEHYARILEERKQSDEMASLDAVLKGNLPEAERIERERAADRALDQEIASAVK
ncbi:MAG: hypothetical protein HY731_14985, partial [Candidatus Tectomicrobia bacterium]|nr:hypothetical protein [Candidatus Tectomicrobia bacterium]